MSKMTVRLKTTDRSLLPGSFAASPEAVYRAHAEPRVIQKWIFGPNGLTMPGWITMAKGGAGFRLIRKYSDPMPFGRLVHVERAHLPDPAADNHVKTTFEPDGPGTLMIMRTQPIMGITKYLRAVPVFVASVILSAGLLGAQEAGQAPAVNGWSQNAVLRIEKEVRKQIVSLPQYGVFDDIHFGIQGKTIILNGQASRPSLQSSAENVVKKIEDVEAVDNRIEVLPLSPNDDRIRAAVYARIYSYPALQKYSSNRGGGQWLSLTRRTMGITNDPPIGYHAIHIIVKNGNVTLKGVVDNSSDLAIAGMQADLTPGVFHVDNDLFIANEEK